MRLAIIEATNHAPQAARLRYSETRGFRLPEYPRVSEYLNRAA